MHGEQVDPPLCSFGVQELFFVYASDGVFDIWFAHYEISNTLLSDGVESDVWFV